MNETSSPTIPRSRLYIDIETLPREYTDKERLAIADPKDHAAWLLKHPACPKNYKDPEKIAPKVVEYINKTGLDPLQGIIACVCFAFDDGIVHSVANPNGDRVGEIMLMSVLQDEFLKVINAGYRPIWVGHNCNSFDWPYLWLRALKYKNHALARLIPNRKFDSGSEDTMLLAGGTDYRKMMSLRNLCDWFDIPRAEDDGGMIADLWKAGKFQSVVDKCIADVEATRALHKVLLGD